MVERGKVPLYPPLGFESDGALTGEDVYFLFRFGELGERIQTADRGVAR